MTQTFDIIPGMQVGEGQNLLLIAGPCQIESLEHCLKIATFLKDLCKNLPINLVFKSSFDKANRTSMSGQRGPGAEAGLEILASVKKETGLPILTDIHTAEQASAAAKVADILQTPAFLCRQTDLLVAAGKSGKTVNCKKGQFLHPEDMRYSAEKIASSGNSKILLCERGTCFGYRDLVVDPRSLLILNKIGFPVVFDATHSVQSMGGAQGASGGNREYIIPLIRSAVSLGVHGLFIECHDDPERAPSDGASMLPLQRMKEALDTALIFRDAYQKSIR